MSKKFLIEQEKIDNDKLKKIEQEKFNKKIQSPINRDKIDKIEREKKKNSP
jgi:hypothetical protein